MQIIGIGTLHEFARSNSGLRSTIRRWISTTSQSEWSNSMELENSFPGADYNSRHDAYIFNLGGNFRLIAQITFSSAVVDILDIKNHDDYMKWSNKR